VSDRDGEMKGVGQLGLEFGFPSPAAITVAAAGIGENQELARATIAAAPLALPPVSDGMSREGGSVMGDADDHRTTVGDGVVEAIGNSDPDRVGAEVVIVDQSW
jgi:hypothetical protein